MKNNYFLFAVLLLLLVSEQVHSQHSEGGTPVGFKYASSDRLRVEQMPPVDVASLLREDSVDHLYKDRPYRFGFNHLVNYSPDNSGEWTTLPDGSRIWQLDVKSPGALTINLAFSNYHLPEGAKLFIYSKDHSQVLGAFTSKNNSPDQFFGSELITGNEVVVEYFEPVQVRGQGKFILFRVTHGYKDLNNLFRSFAEAGSCINNINCPQYAAFTTQKRSVVCILTGSNAICSGALVNNTLNDGTPYILTANHCGTADGAWVFRFNWEAPGCADPPASPPYQSIAQGTPIASDTLSDFNLVQMGETPPANYHVFYAGWSRSTTPATSVTCIHHPQGDIKKCSRADNPVTATSEQLSVYAPAAVWQIGLWTDGVTEPGSSGSPLFDQNKRIIGQLYGGTSECGEPDFELTDFYGRFNVSWDTGVTPQTRLRDWLDPQNTNTLTNDGYDPNPPVYTLDLAATGVTYPPDTLCGTSVAPVITVQNLGSNTVYNFTVSYHIDSFHDSVYIYQGDSIVYFQTLFISLPALQTTPGNHILYATVSLPNDSTDQNEGNNTTSLAFVVSNTTGVMIPFREGFEEDTFPPVGWALTTPVSGTTWQQDSIGAYGLSSVSASVNEFSPLSSTVGEMPELITPFIDLSNIHLPVYLTFDVANARFDSLYYDSLAVLASADCGITWTRIYARGGLSLATAPDDSFAFIPDPSQWRTDSINISDYNGQPAVQFAFELISGYGNITYIDNVDINDSSLSVGIQQLADNMLVKVYPNPFTQSFTVQFNLAEPGSISVSLYSVEGKLLKRVMQNTLMGIGVHQLNISSEGLSSGLYFLDINNHFIKLEKQ